MTILTNLPVTLTCGTPAIVTLDPAQLITDFGIVDAFWSDSANWKNVRFIYGSDQASQSTKIVFDILTGTLNLSTNAYDGGWLCSKILIWDGLENQLVLKRAVFPVANEFDFASTGGYNPIAPIALWGTYYGETASTGSGELHRTGVTNGWDNSGRSQYALLGDFSFTGSVDVLQVNAETMIGYTKAPTIVAPSGPDFSTAFYIHTTIIAKYAGGDNTALTISAFSPNVGTRNFEIIRTAGVITAKINGQTIFTDNYSGAVYVGASIYQDGYTDITSALLTEP